MTTNLVALGHNQPYNVSVGSKSSEDLSESISVNEYTKTYLMEGGNCDIKKHISRTLNDKSDLITIEELDFINEKRNN